MDSSVDDLAKDLENEKDSNVDLGEAQAIKEPKSTEKVHSPPHFWQPVVMKTKLADIKSIKANHRAMMATSISPTPEPLKTLESSGSIYLVQNSLQWCNNFLAVGWPELSNLRPKGCLLGR